MINVNSLKEAGIDYEAGMERFMNDGELYEAVLNAFVESDIHQRARRAYDAGDKDMLLKAVHEAKGSGGNAGLNRIYEEANTLTLMLRSGSYGEAEFTKHFNLFEEEYAKARNGILAALGK